ncbi:MAG: macro domain-containing protein [Lachnospiraceae bacterium]|nr:macro domain-containing protein [Lachnospiraceae bacterium]
MPFQIIRNDITKVHADAIVNTANPNPVYGLGTDAAIYKAAGEEALLAERKKIGDIAPGDVAVTSAGKLDANYIIHTVGPAWIDGESGEFDVLRSCYAKSLEKAEELGCESIAFPLIATGVYGFPKDKALRIAIDEIGAFLMNSDADILVYLVVFDENAFKLSKNLFFRVESYITDKKVIKAHLEEYGMEEREIDKARMLADRSRRELARDLPLDGPFYSSNVSTGKVKPIRKVFDSDTFDKELYKKPGKDEGTFLPYLIDLLNEKGIDNATAYKSSNIDRKVFSKIMCGDTKIPQKKTLLGLCIGLKLSLGEASKLLASADMAFNPLDNRDNLVVDCIRNRQYNIMEVNIMLSVCGYENLGSIQDSELDKQAKKGQK